MNNAFGTPQRALILGAGSDIAAELAVQLAEVGTTDFVLASRNPESLANLQRALSLAGARQIECLSFDALDRDSHPAFVQDVWDRHGDIDLAIIAFGILDDELAGGSGDFETVTLTNYVGGVSVLTQLGERFAQQRFGSIVVLSSVAAERPRADNYLYASSKAGLDAYTQGLGDALAPYVHVMIVRPGFVTTKMTESLDPAPFATNPKSVATDIMAGLRKRANVVWSPPIVRAVMSGLRHLPTPIYRKLAARA